MTFASIMVHVDLGSRCFDRIRLACSLADRFKSRIIGVAALAPQIPIANHSTFVDEALLDDSRRQARAILAEAETLFRKAAGERSEVEWRSSFNPPTAFLIENARAADLIVVGRQGRDDRRDWQLGIDVGDILMGAGRPVLVSPGVEHLAARRILVAWRNTAEARRAVRDALPFLKGAEEVSLISVGEACCREGARDVETWLKLHGVDAECRFVTSPDSSEGDEILSGVEERFFDMIVAGAFGRSRLREWVLGGVTRDLLDHAPVHCLMSH